MARRACQWIAAFALAAVFAGDARAQQQPDTVVSIAGVHDVLMRYGEWLGPVLWPGFRPDTVATFYMIPGQAKLFVHHGDGVPAGFRPYPGRPGWAWAGTESVSFAPGHIAFVPVQPGPAMTLALAVHEAFHEYQEASAREGRALGRRENAVLVSGYPSFDEDNEALFALESSLLGAALAAANRDSTIALTRRFLEVRARRHAALGEELALFEREVELNEGLAQYTQVRTLMELRAQPGFLWSAEAERGARSELARLDRPLEMDERSVRRRFYTTGTAIALLLDRFRFEAWKHDLMETDVTLEALLAAVVGTQALSDAELERLFRRHGADLRQQAGRVVTQLAASRAAHRDSILAQRGTPVLLAPPHDHHFDWCGFDPQNLLRTAAGELLHTRWIRLCLDGQLIAEINGGAVQYPDGAVAFVLPPSGRATIAGEDVTIPAQERAMAGQDPPLEWAAARDVEDLELESESTTVSAASALVRLESAARPRLVIQVR